MKHWLTFWIAALCMAAPASAQWHEASSDNFVIYADDNTENIQGFAETLERYHSAMEVVTGRTVEKPSPSNRVTVYVAGSQGKVRKLAGAPNVAGFYIARPGGSTAFVQDVRTKDGRPDISTTILLHEYAHHFLASINRFAMPQWMNEGAAEFFAASYFAADGSVHLGLPSSHRFREIFHAKDDAMRIQELLAFNGSANDIRTRDQAFYGRSWLLYHYLSTDVARDGQLREYWIEVLRGTPSVEAGEKVFGSLSVLERELDKHWRRGNPDGVKVEPEQLDTSKITLRELSDGEAAIIDVRMRSQRGVSGTDAMDLAIEARAIAASYQDDPRVLAVLAKAEYDAGVDDAAIAAADRAIAITPELTDAYAQKGLALFRKARRTSGEAAKNSAYELAIQPFITLKALEGEHVLPLMYAYRSYLERDFAASEDAKKGFIRAAELAPFDHDLWLVAGMLYMNDGRISDAKAALQPLVSNPHGDEKVANIRNTLAFLATKKDGDIVPVQQAISAYFREE